MAQRVKAETIELIEFAENFRFARKKQKLTQHDIRSKTTLSQDFISALETASTGIGIDSMSALSHSVKVPLYCILEPGFQNAFNFESQALIWEQYLQSLPVCEHGASERLVFGQNFKAAREAIQYTQEKIFTRTGIPDTTITHIERGITGVEFLTMVRLARSVSKSLFLLFKT